MGIIYKEEKYKSMQPRGKGSQYKRVQYISAAKLKTFSNTFNERMKLRGGIRNIEMVDMWTQTTDRGESDEENPEKYEDDENSLYNSTSY
jgi:hypothetical protein